MDCDCCGFDERALLQAHVLGKLVAVVLRQSVVPGKGTIVGRCGSKSHVRAEVVLALLATQATTAGNTGLHCDTVANLQCLDLTTDLLNDTGRFVAKNHGLLDDEVTDTALDPVVNI